MNKIELASFLTAKGVEKSFATILLQNDVDEQAFLTITGEELIDMKIAKLQQRRLILEVAKSLSFSSSTRLYSSLNPSVSSPPVQPLVQPSTTSVGSPTYQANHAQALEVVRSYTEKNGISEEKTEQWMNAVKETNMSLVSLLKKRLPWELCCDLQHLDFPTTERKLLWIPRRVESPICELFEKGNFFLHVRGRRRMGKKSTVERCALKSQKRLITVTVSQTNEEVLSSFNVLLATHGYKQVNNMCELQYAIVQLVREGFILYLDEIQQSSEVFQERLQVAIDTLRGDDYRPGFNTKTHGGIVVSGSFPVLVEQIISHPTKPLYERVTTRYVIEEFTPEELGYLFKKYGVMDPKQQLMYFSLFGGIPHYYAVACLRGCLSNTVKLMDVVSELCVREQASPSYQKDSLSAEQLVALQVIATGGLETKGAQIKAVKEELDKQLPGKNNDTDEAALALEALNKRFFLLTYLTAFNCPQKGLYVLQDRFMLTSFRCGPYLDSSNHMVIQGNDSLIARPKAPQQLEEKLIKEQRLAFEALVRKIIHARDQAMLPVLPGEDLGHPYSIHYGTWHDMPHTEIDLVCSSASQKTVILGSLKRVPEAQNARNLMLRVTNMFHFLPDFFKQCEIVVLAFISPTTPNASNLASAVDAIANNLDHFVADPNNEEHLHTKKKTPNKMKKKKFRTVVCSLEQLMQDFMSPLYTPPAILNNFET